MFEWYVPNTNIHGMKEGDLNLVSSPALFNNTFPYKSNVMVQYIIYVIIHMHLTLQLL